MESGIYKITNIENGKIYIGKANNIKERINTHKSRLNAGFHVNLKLQEDFKIYGESSFEFEILEHTNLLERTESAYCYENDVWNPNVGYNIGKLRDYSVISFIESIKLGTNILRTLVTKNPQLFTSKEKSFEIPIQMISSNYNIDKNIVYIALFESIKYTEITNILNDWNVSIESDEYLKFFNNILFEQSVNSFSFF